MKIALRRFTMTKSLSRKIISAAAALVMLLSLLRLPVFATPVKTLRVGVNPGFGISTVAGGYSGFALDFLREIQKRSGYGFEYVPGTIPELAKKLANGEIDIIPCVTEDECVMWQRLARREGYSEDLRLNKLSLMTKHSSIYIRDDSDIDYGDAEDLKNIRIGYLSEAHSVYFPREEFVAPELRSYEFVSYNTEQQMRADFESGKLGAVIKDCFRVWGNELVAYPLLSSECYFMVTEDDPDLITELDVYIGGIKLTDSRFSSDLYEKHTSKYGTVRYAFSEKEKYYIRNNPSVKVAYNLESSFVNNGDAAAQTLTDAVPELMKELSNISGIELTLVPYKSLEECVNAMREGKVEAICGGVNADSVSLFSKLRLSAPYARVPIAGVAKKDSSITSRARIAIPTASEDISTYITDSYPGSQVLRYDTERKCLDAVRNGEADIVFASAYELMWALNNGYNGLEITEVKSTFHSECFAFPEDSVELPYIMGKSIACMSDNTVLIRTFSTGSEGSAAISNRWLKNIIIGIAIVILTAFASVMTVLGITSVRSKKQTDIDPLTGGRSRKRYLEDTKKLLKRSGSLSWAIVLFDIDKFKYVNDRLGYEEGNRMLERLHKTISDHLEKDEVYARFSDDNFVMTIKDVSDSELTSRINSIFNEFDRRNSLFVKYPVIFSAGVCRLNRIMTENTHREVDINSAIDRCKIAKSTLKGTHYSSIAFYDGSIRDKALREKDYENMMPEALKRREFECYLQPKYGLRSRNIEGAEALIRWNSKEFGFIPPGEFIPIAEKNGFVVELDFFILEEVCRTMRRWLDDGKKSVVISVNQSRLHLNYDDYIWRLREIVDKYEIPYENIELELTESVFTENAEKLLKIMHKLHEIGFKLSLDDFGSGYSSLNMLKDMPVDVVKIDKEFFSDTMNTEKGRAVISTVVDLAQNLNMEVISEGVETREQVDFLTEIHCGMVQGYYFAKPLPISEFEKLWFADLENIRMKKEMAAAQQQKRLEAIGGMTAAET